MSCKQCQLEKQADLTGLAHICAPVILAAHPAVREGSQHLLLLLIVMNMCHVNGGEACASLLNNVTVSTMLLPCLGA